MITQFFRSYIRETAAFWPLVLVPFGVGVAMGMQAVWHQRPDAVLADRLDIAEERRDRAEREVSRIAVVMMDQRERLCGEVIRISAQPPAECL